MGHGGVGREELQIPGLAGPPMTLADRSVFLRSALGRGLAPRDVAQLLGTGGARIADWPQGTLAAQGGSRQSEFFLVLSGQLEVARVRADGTRQIHDLIGPGGLCGAVTAFGPEPRWPADVEVRSDARVVALRPADLIGEGAAVPDAARHRVLVNCILLVAERARHMNGRVELLSRRGMRERIAYFLLRRSQGGRTADLTITRQEMADVLAVSRSSMTRELGRWADEGLIAMRGRGFELLDREALARLA